VQNGLKRLTRLFRAPVLALSLCALLGQSHSASAAAVGEELKNGEVRDGNDKPATLPDFGERVLLILYTDPDVADQNDAFADLVKKAGLPQSHFRSMGIANMQDAPIKPNWIIRSIVRGKVKKYNVTILTDPKHYLIEQWGLGDCNNKSVVLIVGKDKKLHFFEKGALSPEKAQAALAKLCQLIAADGGPEGAGCKTPPKPAN
jgi:predicted transcriptional regulator